VGGGDRGRRHPDNDQNAGGDAAAAEEVTEDALLRGRIKLYQPVRGFRSSLDPVLLAGFVAPPFGRFLDIGCGTGALAFLLLARDPAAKGVGLELQPRLARLAARGVAANGFGWRFHVLNADAREPPAPALGGGFDLAVSNPPFQPVGQGDLPPDPERRVAHHEVELKLGQWLDLAARQVRPGGRVAAVFTAPRTGELLAGMNARGLRPCRLRLVHPRPQEPATRVLVEAVRPEEADPAAGTAGAPAAPGPVEEPPLYLHVGRGYSPEVRRMLGEEDPG
jgi:tRNA1Val (adenine37-N6)-methyltransferase